MSAEKAADTPANQYGFFPANVWKPYAAWQVVPCMQMRGNNLYFKFYVTYGSVSNGYSGSMTPGGGVYADPGVVDAQHYCVNFQVYP
jgi:hypothetical protein